MTSPAEDVRVVPAVSLIRRETSDIVYLDSKNSRTDQFEVFFCIPALAEEISPDVPVARRTEDAGVQCGGDADLEDDGELDVIQVSLLQSGEGLGRQYLVVEDEVHVNKIAEKSN